MPRAELIFRHNRCAAQDMYGTTTIAESASYPGIRMLTVNTDTATTPLDDIRGVKCVHTQRWGWMEVRGRGGSGGSNGQWRGFVGLSASQAKPAASCSGELPRVNWHANMIDWRTRAR